MSEIVKICLKHGQFPADECCPVCGDEGEKWFKKLLDKYKDTPEFIAETALSYKEECGALGCKLSTAEARVRELEGHQDAAESLLKEVKRLDKELAAAEGKAKTAIAYCKDVLIDSPWHYAGKRIIEILRGEP